MMQTDSSNAELFKRSFREEAREILTELEGALLQLNECRDDVELIGRIFRGLHTIKGSGAMFGFEQLAGLAHELESAFDKVRNGQLEASGELIDATMEALDQIGAMLEEETGSKSADAAARAAIVDRVRRLAGVAESEHPAPKIEPAGTAPVFDGPARKWRIRFAPGPDLMRFGANPLLLVRELNLLGELTIQASMESVPPLSSLDPERCYIAWEMTLATAAGLHAIRDVFIFVEDTCELSIAPEGGASEQPVEMNDAERTARALMEKRSGSGRREYDKPDNATSLRVAAAKLDQLVNLVGELVTVQARLSEMAAVREDAEVAAIAEEVERLTSALRENSMNIRMIPIRGTFEKFRRLVHDLARDLGKDVELAIEGAETELDKSVIEQLGDPLMHLIRNSMDHGVEPAADRIAQGKPATARITLSARYSGASVMVSVSDDGRGIDCAAVRAHAIAKGVIAAETQLSSREVFALIFQPGFSTARQVTDVSGRGVGMDVVRQRVESLRGTIEVASSPGSGTTVTMRLPLTMAIIDGLLVTVGDGSFVLPMASTLECVELTREDIQRANGKHLATVRGEIVPYVRLREYFNVPSSSEAIEQIMLVETGEGRVGFVVDKVLGSCQTVIKSLGRMYRQVQMVSGATILGNGAVALILDPDRLVQDAIQGEQGSEKGRYGSRASRPRDGTLSAAQRRTEGGGAGASALRLDK